MDIRQLESLVVVAEQGSFSEAARILHISQPSISTHISALEKELGVRLFNRTTKKVVLTSQGKEVYEYALGIFNLTKRIRDLGSSPNLQTLQLGASSVPSAYMLPEIMRGFREEYPDCRIALRQSDSAIVVEELLDGVCDVGIVGDVIKANGLSYTPILEDRNVLVTANNEHFRALKKQVDKEVAQGADPTELIRDILTKEPVIMRENGSGSRRFFDLFLTANDLKFSSIRIAAFCNDMEAVKNMVAKGVGISIAPELSVAKEISKEEVIAFDLTKGKTVDMRTFYLVTKREKRKNSLKNQFVQYVKKMYGLEK